MTPFSALPLHTPLGKFTVIRGGQQGPWVMCWPSVLADHRCMLAFGEILAQTHRVVLMDPPGYGANHAEQPQLELDDRIVLAHQIIDALGIEKLHWVGQGYGCHIGAGVAVRIGYRMLSMTMSGAPLVQPVRINIPANTLTTLAFHTSTGRHIIASNMADQMSTSGSREHRLTYKNIVGSLEHCDPSALRNMRLISQETSTRLREQLDALKIPKLVIAGRKDNLVLPRDQQTLAELLKARYIEINSGFMTYLTRPLQCATAFLDLKTHALALDF